MKKLFTITVGILAAISCSDLLPVKNTAAEKATLIISFEKNSFPETVKSGVSVPDTNDFHLSVCDDGGTVIYDGRFGDAPASLIVEEGCYSISARSCEFNEPLFDCPQWGDTQLVIVESGRKVNAKLVCRQMNAGLRLIPDDSFFREFPYGEIYLRAAEGTLLFSRGESRTAFFRPGNISLILDNDGIVQTLVTRSIGVNEIETLTLSAAAGTQEGEGSVHIAVDTTRTRYESGYTVGEGDAGEMENAYSVGEAVCRAGEKGVWVYGYIVGGDLTSTKFSTSGPFSSRTNIVLSSKSNGADRSACLSVQMSKGDIRDELNLVDHPENLGRQVLIKGDILDSYYGLTGLGSLSEFAWK